jgi:hypothetical protein
MRRPDGSPELLQYRVTLFFGPEPLEGARCGSVCVFNVKKRSWKGGIQVAVELRDDQLDRALKRLDFPSCLEQDLKTVTPGERPEIEHRATDALIQLLCSYKLELAIDEGLTSENQCIRAERFDEALDQTVAANRDRLVASVRRELDFLMSGESPT